MNKKQFIDAMTAIQKQSQHDDFCVNQISLVYSDAFKANLLYNNTHLLNAILKILSDEFNDTGDWIGYYIYDLEWGEKWEKNMVYIGSKEYKLKTKTDLYNLLKSELEKNY